MKKISTKDVEVYLYSSVILPLKALDVERFSYPSPFVDKAGFEATISIGTPIIDRSEYTYRYERELAHNGRPKVVICHYRGKAYVLAEYSPKRKVIEVFEHTFEKKLPYGRLMFRKLVEAFEQAHPFSRVKITRRQPEYDWLEVSGVYGGVQISR